MVLEGLIVEVASRLTSTKPFPWVYLQETINDISGVPVLANIWWDVHNAVLYLVIDIDLRV